jgi:hypothetical protein
VSDSETTGDAGADAEETMRERTGRSTFLSYLLVEANRWALVVGMLLALFAGLVLVSQLLPGGAAALRTGDPIETLLQALVGATVTGVTLVLTLNQLVLSQELGAIDDQRERMAGAMEFRTDVESYLDDPAAPTEPSAFLRALVTAAGDRAERLGESVGDDPDDEAGAGVRDLAEGVSTSADRARESLADATFGEYDVVDAALDFEYSRKLYRTRRLREGYGDRLSEATCDALDELEGVLRLFGPAREHFKTLYFQSELVGLSRAVLVASLPSLVVTAGMLAFFDASNAPAPVLGIDGAVLAISATTAVALLPFLVLLSYVLRIAAITGQTLSIGPFVLRETDREATTETADG